MVHSPSTRHRTEVVTVASTEPTEKKAPEPTHTVTHKETHTSAYVNLGPGITKSYDDAEQTGEEPSLTDGEKKFVAIRFKNTPPLPRSGRDLSGERVNFGDLNVQPYVDPSYGEPQVPMGPGGTVLDDYDE